ncbi:MAG: type II secretion system protein GspG, partial [Planctomycetota bacterium]|nr:type II secretion system protein GspG [Planctomycetota bacterium]
VPLDVSLMPSEQSISQHLDMELQGSAFAGNDPSLTINRSRSQFTGSDFMPLIAVAAVFGIGVAAEMPMEGEVAEPEISPEEIARADIAGLRASLTVYKISERSYPDALHDLLRSLPDYPNGCYPHAELPSDPWGGDYLYRIDGRKAVVWSAGPNGIDEDGEGDDVTRSR